MKAQNVYRTNIDYRPTYERLMSCPRLQSIDDVPKAGIQARGKDFHFQISPKGTVTISYENDEALEEAKSILLEYGVPLSKINLVLDKQNPPFDKMREIYDQFGANGKSKIDRKELEEDRVTVEKQMPSEVRLVPTLQEQGFIDSIAVYCPIADLNFRNLFDYHLPNIETLLNYSKHIPIEIRSLSNVSCQVWRIYLQRKRGIFGLTKRVRSSLSGEYSLKDSVKLTVEESLPIEVQPGRSTVLHVPTDSILDVNREMEGDNVAIVIKHSHGTSKSRTFSSVNFWIYPMAVKFEFYRHTARLFLKQSVYEVWDANKLKECLLEYKVDLGLDYWPFLQHLFAVAEGENMSLGLSDELVNEIRDEYKALLHKFP